MTQIANQLSDRLPATTGVVAGLLAASCCLLPLSLIAIGVAGPGLMMTMMHYDWLTLPLGVGGLGGAHILRFRQRRRCDRTGCRLMGQRTTTYVLSFASAVIVAALLLRLFPSWTADVLQRLS